MEFSHCYNVYFRWSATAPQRNVQGFWIISSKSLALEQSQQTLKALAFKAYGFVQYTL